MDKKKGNNIPITKEWAAYLIIETVIKKYGNYVHQIREGESDEDFRRKSTLIWIAVEQEYAL